MEKIVITLPPDAWHGYMTETVWAEKIGNDRYRLRSVPFYAKGVSVEDVVLTRLDKGRPTVERVILHGGHSTYRVFLAEGVPFGSGRFKAHWMPLNDLGCTFERATERLIAIDVPPTASLRAAYELLERGEADAVWALEEGYAATK